MAEFVSRDYHYALVGASTHKEKYGYTVLKDLAEAGYKIVGVNPHYLEIDGIAVYPSLKDVPQKPDVVIFVVPPDVGLRALDEVAALGIQKVWFQPGAESRAIRTRAQDLGLQVQAHGNCLMVARRVQGL